MKRLVAGLIFAAGVLAGCVAHHFIVIPPATAQTPPARWEYLCSHLSYSPDEVTEAANRAGQEGWEMVTTDTHKLYCFKRLVQFVPQPYR